MDNSPFQNKLKECFGLEPNEGQHNLFLALENFLRARELQQILIIKGYAGTGKTSALSAFVKTLNHYKVKSKLMAPTGRAAKVLSGMAGNAATTIHRSIYWRKSKADLNAPFTLKPNLSKNTVFIVDEASMIGEGGIDEKSGLQQRDLLSDLIEHVYQGKGCQLILIGDEGQLPPVGVSDSPALNAVYLKYHFPSFAIETIRLDQVHRQALESSILWNATELRKEIAREGCDIKFDLHRGNDLYSINGVEFQDLLEVAYDQVGKEETLIITRSNKRANLYNQQIRSRILWYEELLCGGDDLMVVKNNYFWQNESKSIDFIANGDLLKVIRIKSTENLYGFEFCKAIVTFPDYPDHGELEVVLHTETLNADGPNLDRNRMKELFFKVEEDYLHLKSKKERYEAILQDPYFNALQVKYAYAVTCHKAQGGQWDRVFIDQGYVPEEEKDVSHLRWLYTALTRAKKCAYLVNYDEAYFIQNH